MLQFKIVMCADFIKEVDLSYWQLGKHYLLLIVKSYKKYKVDKNSNMER